MSKPTLAALAAAIDNLGATNAQIADLKAVAETCRDVIVRAGKPAFEGEMFRATVSTSTRTTTDYKSLLAQLVGDKVLSLEQHSNYIEAFTTTGEPSTTVKVTARRVTA